MNTYLEAIRSGPDYLTRLQSGDPEAVSHFKEYFSVPVCAKLQSHFPGGFSDQLAEGVINKALEAVRTNGLTDPTKIAACVFRICHNAACAERGALK